MEWLFLTVEIMFVGVLLAGVAMIYVPAAMILGGALGVWAIERAIDGRAAAVAARAGRVTPMAGRKR